MKTFPVRTLNGRPEVEGIARSTEASIDIINAIDETIDTLTSAAEVMTGLSKLLAATTEKVTATTVTTGDYLDAEDLAIGALERSEALLKNYLAKIALKRSTIDKDASLKDHHCESLHDAYETAMDATAMLIDESQTLRCSIITHDLKAEPRDGVEEFPSVNALIERLNDQ